MLTLVIPTYQIGGISSHFSEESTLFMYKSLKKSFLFYNVLVTLQLQI